VLSTWRAGRAAVPGGELYYETAGEGPALVLIHADFLDHRMWEPQFESLTQDHRAVRYDARGHGRSTVPGGPYSDGEDLRALLDHLGIASAYLVGLAHGARIASEFAAAEPRRVRGLVLAAGAPPDFEPTVEEDRLFLDTYPFRGERILVLTRAGAEDEAVEAMLTAWAPRVPDAQRGTLATIARDNLPAMRRLAAGLDPERPLREPVEAPIRLGSTPVLVLAGSHDNPALAQLLARFARQSPSAHFVEVAEGDHLLNWSAPAQFEELVRDFVTTVEAGRPWPPSRSG
jgi:3-oxoadipate enol-lactonase